MRLPKKNREFLKRAKKPRSFCESCQEWSDSVCIGCLRAVPSTAKRVVLGEGKMRYSMSKCLILEGRTATGLVRGLVEWPELQGDPLVRLVLEVVE